MPREGVDNSKTQAYMDGLLNAQDKDETPGSYKPDEHR